MRVSYRVTALALFLLSNSLFVNNSSVNFTAKTNTKTAILSSFRSRYKFYHSRTAGFPDKETNINLFYLLVVSQEKYNQSNRLSLNNFKLMQTTLAMRFFTAIIRLNACSFVWFRMMKSQGS